MCLPLLLSINWTKKGKVEQKLFKTFALNSSAFPSLTSFDVIYPNLIRFVRKEDSPHCNQCIEDLQEFNLVAPPSGGGNIDGTLKCFLACILKIFVTVEFCHLQSAWLY